jgi:hypothetical protein
MWSAWSLGRFTPLETFRYPLGKRLDGRRIVLGTMERRHISYFCQESNLIPQLTYCLYRLSCPYINMQWTYLWNRLSFTAKMWSFLTERSKHLSISLERTCDGVAQHQLLDPICYFNCRSTPAPYPHSLADDPVPRRARPITTPAVSLVTVLGAQFALMFSVDSRRFLWAHQRFHPPPIQFTEHHHTIRQQIHAVVDTCRSVTYIPCI